MKIIFITSNEKNYFHKIIFITSNENNFYYYKRLFILCAQGIGLNFINQIPNIGCIIIDDYDKTYSSKNINIT